ncbi:hypothetical protein BO71DRAFT_485155 [Aspergillus ellipticus CBS 707.79]|uniref:Apple domain-containing protein n=1 Tax=Aspergillus ellipticus CBS 707.79 TaxID=1448320 RepID=A0A319DNG9_9EURO|nr:hypothetical protein BO71DRAFT_485155 [Aspergillus ellipticus CBS 707.79]
MKHPLFSTTVLLAALAQATNALTSRAGISLQTITATSFSTVTQTSTSTFETATVTSTCAVGTAPPTVTSCVPTVWASGSNYYQQWCSSTWLHSGSAIAAFANIPYSSCVSHCLQTAECGGINFATAGAAELCYLSAGSMTISAGASYDQVMLVETKNPCVSTVTGVVASEMVVGVTTVPFVYSSVFRVGCQYPDFILDRVKQVGGIQRNCEPIGAIFLAPVLVGASLIITPALIHNHPTIYSPLLIRSPPSIILLQTITVHPIPHFLIIPLTFLIPLIPLIQTPNPHPNLRLNSPSFKQHYIQHHPLST